MHSYHGVIYVNSSKPSTSVAIHSKYSHGLERWEEG